MQTLARAAEDEAVIFEQTVQGLLRTAGGRPLPPDAQARLAALGIVEGRLLPAYPLAAYVEALAVVRKALFGALPEEEGSFALGRAFLRSYEGTLLGRALLATCRVLGPRRVLARMTRNFRTANNYTETRLEELGGGRYALWFNRTVNTHYYRGLLHEAVVQAGGQNPEVQVHSHGPGGTVFHVRWEG
jgi:uncharacterized protein (TIGR02265 family)